MIYKDDEFRYIKDGDRAYKDKLEQYEELKQNKSLEMKNQLSEFSPKLFKIMTNIQKFITASKKNLHVLDIIYKKKSNNMH